MVGAWGAVVGVVTGVAGASCGGDSGDDEPPSIDAREITDKGSLNQKAVLLHRSAIVDEIYEPKPGPRVIVANERSKMIATASLFDRM